MKNTILCLFFLLNFFSAHSQKSPHIEIGKRGNWLFDKKIDPFKVGRLRYAMNPFFFRPSNEEEFRKSGWQGRHIISYLEDDDIAMHEFKRYQRNRFLAFTTYGVSVAAVFGWMIRTTDNAFSGRGNSVSEILFTERIAATLLASSLTATIASSFLAIESDKNLFNAVQIYNKNAGYSSIKPRLGLGLTSVSFQDRMKPAIGLRLSW